MPKGRRSDPKFRAEVAKKFRQVMKERGWSQARAARELGVKRQAFHQYVRGATTPRADVLARACINWGITLGYRGHVFGKEAFDTTSTPPDVKPVQLNLFDDPQVLRNRHVEVKIGSKGTDSLELLVNIRFAS